jgi:acyl carrier protein
MNDGPKDAARWRTLLVAQVAARARVAPDQVQPDAHLVLDLGLSSLEVLDVIAIVEQHSAVRFPDEQLATLTSIERIEDALQALARAST